MKGRVIPLLVIAAAAVAAIGWFYHNGAQDRKAGPRTLPKPEIIKTAFPERRNFTVVNRWFGRVESGSKTRVIALEAGRVISIEVADGASVEKDDILFTLGGPIFENRMETLRSRALALKRRLEIAKGLVKIKREALAGRYAKVEEVKLAEDAVATLGVEIDSVKQEIQRLKGTARICATTGGIFSNRKVSVGQEVEKGYMLAEVISKKKVYITVELFPGCTGAELKKKNARIDLPQGGHILGNVTTVFPERTPEGATMARIEAPGLASAFNPGQVLTGTIVLSAHEKALALPQSAVVRDDEEQAYIFLKGSSGYTRRPVDTGAVDGKWIEVTSGLKEGDRVVVQGAYELFYRKFNKIYKVAD